MERPPRADQRIIYSLVIAVAVVIADAVVLAGAVVIAAVVVIAAAVMIAASESDSVRRPGASNVLVIPL